MTKSKVRQLKRALYRCNTELFNKDMERAKEKFDIAWKLKCEIGEEYLMETDFQLYKNIYHLKRNFYPTIK